LTALVALAGTSAGSSAVTGTLSTGVVATPANFNVALNATGFIIELKQTNMTVEVGG